MPTRKQKKQGPEILRAVRLGGGTLVHPGDEDQLEKTIEDDIAQEDARRAEAGLQPSGNTVGKVLTRLAVKGYAVGFGYDDADADDTQHPNPDLRANARFAKAAQVQKVVTGPGRRPSKATKGSARPAPVQDDPGDDLGGNTTDPTEVDGETA